MHEHHETRVQQVTYRLLDEGLVHVVEAARNAGISISSKTALRWCLAGLRGIRLESVKVRGQRMTSCAALRRFVAATQDDASRDQVAAPVLDPSSADRVLESFGIRRKH